ncbi:MAG: Fic family protein [Burkholderiaceae bacterium]|nr:Fic family protein [Burkholderiaceae bacterium]
MPPTIAHYDHPAHFEPLLPQTYRSRLVEQARPVVEASLKLQGALAPATRRELVELVRAMNSYYSNRIEGQSTHPVHIEKALHQNFSHTPDIAKRQRIAMAHIEAEKVLEASPATESQRFSSQMLQTAHEALYTRLDEADRTTEEGALVLPGAWRQKQVAVYRHEPPPPEAIAAFLQRADAVYVQPWGWDDLLIAAASAHHRLIWVHPFLDGNGRACRLQLHASLFRLTGGLWSANRGLARQRDTYYLRLSEADMARQGALDGRGNLSEKMLYEWCRFFIAVCQDQVSFMTSMLAPDTLKKRLTALLHLRAQERPESDYRREAVLPMLHVLATGPVSRGDFVQMTGLSPSTARKTVSRLLSDGLLQSDSHRGELRIGFPLDGLQVLFPDLYPEAATRPDF